MILLKKEDIKIPSTVPQNIKDEYIQNFLDVTKNTGRLFLFAGDQKIEHLNQDFYGPEISPDDENPIHMFEIARHGKVGAYATHLGLISRYGQDYKDIRYIVKLNGRTNLLAKEIDDPLSSQLFTVDQIIEFKRNSGMNIVGIGYTIYMGSKYEGQMLHAAAQAVWQAHQHGLLTVLWIYPRSKTVQNELAPELIAGACGIGLCLDTDFVKVNPPLSINNFESAKLLKQATAAAGATRVICSGGTMKTHEDFLASLYHQLHTGGTSGVAVGRNVHQRNLDDAIKLCNEISEILFEDAELVLT